MNTTSGILLTVGIAAMIGLVIALSAANGRNLARHQHREAASVGLRPSLETSRLGYLDWLWRRTDRRRTWGLLEGQHEGWDVRAFLFAHDDDTVTVGARVLTRVFAHSLASVAGLAFDSRTATQRGILIAVDAEGEGETAAFKVRRRRLIGLDARARELLGGRTSAPLRAWAPPARVTIRNEWLFLQSFYVLPKWLSHYVQVSAEICEQLRLSGSVRQRPESALPSGPLF